jgi:hypothetical protein
MLKRQDLIFSPFIYDAGSFQNIELGFTHEEIFRHTVEVAYSGYNSSFFGTYEYLNDGKPTETLPQFFNLIDINYTFNKPVCSKNNYSLYAGGQFANNVDVMTYNYGWAGYFGYFATFGINLTGSINYKFNNTNMLEAGIAIPFVSLVARSPYLMNDDEFIANNYSHNGVKTFFAYLTDGKFETINHLQKVEFNLNYTRLLSEKWAIGGSYNLDFTHYQPVAAFTSIENKFHLSASYTF